MDINGEIEIVCGSDIWRLLLLSEEDTNIDIIAISPRMTIHICLQTVAHLRWFRTASVNSDAACGCAIRNTRMMFKPRDYACMKLVLKP